MTRAATATQAEIARPLTPAEAAAWLGISERTLRDHVKAGEVRYISMGRGLKRERRMFDPVDLQAFVDTRKQVACPSRKEPAPRSGTRGSKSPGADIFYLPERPTSERRKHSSDRSARGSKPSTATANEPGARP